MSDQISSNPISRPQTAGPSASVTHPDFSRPPVGAAGGPSGGPTIPLTVEEYQRLRSMEKQFDELQRAQQAMVDSKEAERLRALAERGQIEEALAEQRKGWEQKHAEAVTRYTQLEQQVYAERKNAAIAEAFHGRSFVGDNPEQRSAAAAMVRRLLQDEFETARDASGTLVVRDKVSGRPAAELLHERLESPQYAIFFAPSSRGGSGSDGTRPLNRPQSNQPGSLESIVNEWKNRQNQYQSFGLHPLG